jgi:small ligand-binding sensory domain FIST
LHRIAYDGENRARRRARRDPTMSDSLQFISATTKASSPHEAVSDLIAEIRRKCADGGLDFGLLFLSPHFGDKAEQYARAVRKELGVRLLVGTTGEGVIGSDEEIERSPAMTLLAGRFPGVELTPLVLRGADLRGSFSDGKSALEGVAAPASAKLFLMLADPFSAPMDHVLDSFNAAFPGIPIIGGMASGSPEPGRNALIVNDVAFRDGAVVVAFSGDVAVDVIVSQGCRPVGPALKVTDARGNVIRHLEGQPPLDHLQELVTALSPPDRELLKNGLFVGRAIDSDKEVLGRGDFLIRGVMGLDRESGAITVGDVIDEGEVVQFHLRDAATAKEDLEMMLTPQALFGQPSGAFLFSCNGRGTRLFDHANGDISALQAFFPGLNVAGFFCAGEIGPIGGRNFLHGHTASVALFRPASPPSRSL